MNIDFIVKECIDKYINKKNTVCEIKYFHPSGKSLPNGSHYQRGGFLQECKANKAKFIIDEAVHSEQYGMREYRGGIITFSTEVNAVQLSDNAIINKIKQTIKTFSNKWNRKSIIHNVINSLNQSNDNDYIGAYSVGNYFQGKYVGDNGEMYNEDSMSVTVNGLSSKGLLALAEKLATAFMQETVLVKDLNTNKIYLADGNPSNEDLDDAMKNINTKC